MKECRSFGYRKDNIQYRGGNPLLLKLQKIMEEQQLGLGELSDRSGVSRSGIRTWLLNRQSPGIDNFVAVLNTLGYDLNIVRK